jgi:hypothetical protein
MAEPKTVTKTVYNTADGPRSIALSDGGTTVIQAGGSAEVTVFESELGKGGHPDLTTTAPKGDAGRASGSQATDSSQTADQQAKAIEELATDLAKGNSPEELAKLAKAEDVSVAKDASPDQIALAIAQKRLGANQ